MTLSYPMWLLIGCQNHIVDEYNVRKAMVLQAPSALKENWSPDIILRLDYTRISALATHVLNKTLKEVPSTTKEFLGFKAKLTPKLSVKRLVISDAHSKEDVQILAVLEGPINWKLGGKKGEETVKLRINTNATVKNDNGQLSLHITKLDSLKAQLSQIKINPLKSVDLSPWIEEWMGKQLANLPPIPMGTINLPVRGIRLKSTPLSQNIELRSNIEHSMNVTASSLALEEDWELWVHQDTLLGWTQQKAFSMGVVGYGVAIDPVELKIQEDAFELALRLWKIEGRGLWWRDYRAQGSIEQKEHKLKLKGDTVTEGETSKRAGLVDPLALIAESFILDGISEQLSQSLPNHKSTQMNGLKWKLQLEDWSANNNAVQLSGSIDVSEAKKKPNKKNTGKTKK
jgi:hypothetical protein